MRTVRTLSLIQTRRFKPLLPEQLIRDFYSRLRWHTRCNLQRRVEKSRSLALLRENRMRQRVVGSPFWLAFFKGRRCSRPPLAWGSLPGTSAAHSLPESDRDGFYQRNAEGAGRR